MENLLLKKDYEERRIVLCSKNKRKVKNIL